MADETTPDAVERQYQDSDGNPCDLVTLCRREPEWAASRLTFERARHAEEVAALRDQLRKVTAERDRERERATKMEAELADRRAHDEDVRTCLEYCDEDDPTPGGIGGLARELLEWFSGRAA